jgi:hypothetical protein
MPLYLGQDDAGTSSFSLQDFEPAWATKMNAAVRESWLESYGPAGVDYARSRLGGGDEAKLTAIDAADAIKKSGIKFGKTIADGQYTRTQLDVLLERQREMAAVKDVRDRTPWDMSSPLRGLGMFGAGIVDPINLATAFVPWTRSLSVLNAARAGLVAESFATRTASRALLGGADAGISTLVLEAPYSYVRNQIGDDYGALDSMANIAFGTAFGGGLHVLGGSVGDVFRRRGPGMVTPNPAADPIAPPAGTVGGGETRIRIGETYEPAKWSVIDADQLTATVDKADNQFRDRTRAAYQTEIQQRANNLDFNLLADSPVMDYGAPTLAADGRIIGGNGRALFISRAYEIGKGGDYRAALEARMVELGIDPDAVRGMQKPVLVRVLQRQVDVKRAAMLSNEGGSTDMSPLEQAKVDAERLGDAQLVVGKDGDLNSPENRGAVRKWLEAQPENKRNGLVDEDGRLSATGIQRLNSALLFKAYGDSPTLGRLIESMDPGSRNLAMALGRTAPVLANARGAIASGDLHPLDIAADIQQAVEKFNSLREGGMKVSDYLAQLDAFGDGLTPEASLLLEFMGRNIASPRRMADAITGFYDRLDQAGNPKQADIFGGAAVPDKMAMLDASIREAEQGLDTAAEVVAGVAPETREATLRAAVAQSVDGRMVDVDAIIGMDETVGTATQADAVAAADRNFEPEQVALADFDASAAVQARLDAAPKWDGVKDAEAALAEADTLLTDTVAAGDQAFKYSRSGQKSPQDDIDMTPGGGMKTFNANKTAVDYGVSRDGKRMEIILVKTPLAERGQGSAREALSSLIAEADARGMQVVLTAEPMDKATSKARLEAFYKSLGFVPNKGRNKDFTTMAGMVREPKANAPTRYARKGLTDEAKQENFKRWSNNAPLVTSVDADTYAFKTGEKIVVEAFHGTKRPDRVGTKFLKKRATSGPMAYHTSDPTLASSYAQSKSDTSLSGENQDYANWFKVSIPGLRNPVDVARAWFSLSPEVKAAIEKRLPDIRTDDDGNVIYEDGGGDIGSYQWELKQTQRGYDRRGNPLKAAVETWLSSGSLFNDEERFLDVLRLAGMPMKDVRYDSPFLEFPAVYKNYIAMQKPLVTNEIPGDVILALEEAASRDRSRAATSGADMWDKNTRTLREWVKELTQPANGSAKYVWTSIPDKVTDVFRSLGYDGIVDWSGKKGGTEHPVYIPFEETQIKSAVGNRGTFDQAKNDILYARGIPAEQAPEFLTESIRQSFGRSTQALLDAGAIKIVATPADIPGGPHPADVKGATAPDGTVYIVAQNVSEAEARGMVLHEVGVHVGMERMLGTEVFGAVLSELDGAIARGESWAQAARAAVPADTPAGLVREEQLAYLVQNAPELPIVQRIIAAVRAWAYRTFEFARENMTLTEADFRAMAVSALHHAAKGQDVGVLAGAYARAQTATAAFKNWFGDSKVVGADGEPLVMYHGTDKDFSVFSSDKGRESRKTFFVTQYPEVASRFAGSEYNVEVLGGSPNVMAVYVRADKPFDYENASHMAQIEQYEKDNRYTDQSISGDVVMAKRGEWFAIETIQFQKAIKSLGFDGFYVKEGTAKNLGVFDPTQIKSATGNRGTFDPTNPDIRYSRGETPEPANPADELKPFDEAVKRAKAYASVLRAAADKLDNDAQATAAMRAAMPDISPVEITDLLDQLRRQVKGLRGVARTARDAMGAEDVAAGLQTEAMRAADMLANNLEMAAVIEKRNAALNMNVRLKATAYVNQFREAGLDFEGFRGLLVGTERKRAGGRISVDAEQKNFRGEWLGGLIADLEKQDLMRQFASGDFDRDISVALWNLGKGGDNSKLAPEAVKIAEVVNKYQTDARNTRNRFGAWIRDLQGYITRQSHDMLKIRDAGEKAYKDFVLPRLDMERSLRDFEGTPDDFLTRVYDDFAAGSHMKTVAGEDDMAALGRGASLARRESVSRVLYFKDGNASFEYNQKFGQGRLAESVLQGLDQAGKSSGLLKLLGTNPEATVTRLFDEYAESLRGDPVRRAKFLENRKELDNLLAQVDGSVNIPGNVTAARISSFFRAWQSMAKLGGALISSVTDLANYAAELRFGQDQNLFTGVLDGVGALTQGRAKGEKQQILSSLGVFHESTLGAVYARFDSPDLLGGKMSAAMQLFFKLNGLNWWTESLRDGYALTHAHYLATNTQQSFDKLPEALRDMLDLYNIDAGKWDILRIATLQQADGRAYMTPEALRTVPRAALENYITGLGRNVSDASVANLLDDLSSALRTMTIDRMHHAVIEPNARARAFMLRGTQPGTVPGELLRFIGQFKSFPVALIQSTLGREVYGRGYDTIGEYMRKGKGDMVGLASFIALSTAMGYAAMSLKDLLLGKNPRPVDDPRTWAAAFVQGGGMGIYGDFLFAKYNRMGGTLTGSMAGPVANLIDTTADLWTRIRTGDDVAATAFNAAVQNTPFMSLFYVRTALNYLVLYKIQEALNPGFLRRMEKRAERENGQTYYLPPTSVAR